MYFLKIIPGSTLCGPPDPEATPIGKLRSSLKLALKLTTRDGSDDVKRKLSSECSPFAISACMSLVISGNVLFMATLIFSDPLKSPVLGFSTASKHD